MEVEHYLTERKCRRCGYLIEDYTPHDSVDPTEYMRTTHESVKEPVLAHCPTCLRDTFQDLVSIVMPKRPG